MNARSEAATKNGIDPAGIESRAQFAEAITGLRMAAGLTVRDTVDRSGGLHGTVSGWFSGQHLPTPASTAMFVAVLEACGVDSEKDREQWIAAVQRVRRLTARRRGDTTVPYRGLEAFRQEDAEWFFGRDELTSVLAQRVASAISGEGSRQFMVIGASGAGKSSLLRAGLAPKVIGGDPRFDGWQVEILQPGSGSLPPSNGDEDTRTVLIVDQFEELWTQCDRDRREEFLRALTELGENTVAVIGLRADFYGLAAEESLLLPLLDDSPMVVGPLTEDQLRAVIVEPALKAGMTVQGELVQVLVGELTPRGSHTASDPGALPLLSHALLGTWQRSTRKTLTVSDYYATDGIAGAVQQSAEEVYGELTERQQQLARRIFLRLVNVDEITQTRRRAPRAELFLGDDDVEDVNAVIDHFALRRLLTVDEETVEVSHEVLLSAWSRLRKWIDSDRTGLAVHRRFTYSAQEWEDSGRDSSALLGPARLALTEDWLGADDLDRSEARVADLNSGERDFLAASIEHRDQEASAGRRRTLVLRRLVSALAAASVIALVLAVVAAVAGISANSERIAADTARDEAMSRQVATEATRMREKDPSLAAQLALAAYDVSETTEARSALLDASGVHAATRIVGPPGAMKARINPAGTIVAVASSDGMMRLYPIVDGAASSNPVSEFLGVSEGTALFAASFSPDGRLLSTGGAGGGALWDVSDPVSPVRGTLFVDADHVVQDMEFSPDGTKLIAGTSMPDVLRWNIDDTAVAVPLPSLPHPASGIVTASFSPDGRLLVAGGRQATLRVWDVAKWDDPTASPIFAAEPDGTTNHYLGVAFSPDGLELAAGSTAREVVRWDMSDPARPRPLDALTGFTSYVNEINYSKDGTRFAAGSSDNTVRVWDPRTVSLIEVLPDSGAITTVDYSQNGQILVTGGLNGVTRVWSMPGPVWAGARDAVFTSPFDGNGSRLLVGVGARGGAMMAWNTEDFDNPMLMPELMPRGEDRFTGASALSTDGRLAVGGTGAGTVYLWDISDPLAPRLVNEPQKYVEGIVGVVALDPSGTLLVVGSQDDNVFALVDVSDPAAPKVLSSTDAGAYPLMMAFRPGEDVLAIANAKNVVDLWDISDPSTPRVVSSVGGFESYAQAVAFSSDGKILTAGSADHSVQMWNVEDSTAPRALSRVEGPEGAIYSVAINKKGDLLAAGVSGGSVWLWDITNPEDPQRFAQLTAYPDRVYDAQFAGDSDKIAGAGPDKTIRLWGTGPDAVSEGICSTAGTLITEDEWERYLPGVPYRDVCGE